MGAGRKALFFDIDGTLLDSKRRIPASAREAIRKARLGGTYCFVNSGRCWCMLKPLSEEIEMDGWLCGCGTEVLVRAKRVFYYHIPQETQEELRKADRIYRAAFVLEGSDGVHYRKDGSGLPPVGEVRQMTAELGALSDRPFDSDYEISKFCIQADERSDLKGIYRAFGDRFDIMDRRGGFYEAVPRGMSKGTALEKTLEAIGVRPGDAWAFGDSANDLPMFQACPNNVAMKDHDPVLEPYTTFVTDSPEEDGIYKALERIGVI